MRLVLKLCLLSLCVVKSTTAIDEIEYILNYRHTMPVWQKIVVFLGGQIYFRWKLDNAIEEERDKCQDRVDAITKARDDCLASTTTRCSEDPPLGPNLGVTTGGNTPGTVRNYVCNNGATIVGSTETICKNDGNWSLTSLPTC